MFRSQYLSQEIENAIGNAYQMRKIVAVQVNISNLLDPTNIAFSEFMSAIKSDEVLRFIQIISNDGTSENLIYASVIDSGLGIAFSFNGKSYKWSWTDTAASWEDVVVTISDSAFVEKIPFNLYDPSASSYSIIFPKLVGLFTPGGTSNSIARLESINSTNDIETVIANVYKADHSDELNGYWYIVSYVYYHRYYQVTFKSNSTGIEVSYVELGNNYRVFETRFTNSDYDLFSKLSEETGNLGVVRATLSLASAGHISAILDLTNEYDLIVNKVNSTKLLIPYIRVVSNTKISSTRYFRGVFNYSSSDGSKTSLRLVTIKLTYSGGSPTAGVMEIAEDEPVAKGLVNAEVFGAVSTKLESILTYQAQSINVSDSVEIGNLWDTLHGTFHFKANSRIYHVVEETTMGPSLGSVVIKLLTSLDNGVPVTISVKFNSDALGSYSWYSAVISLDDMADASLGTALATALNTLSDPQTLSAANATSLMTLCKNRSSFRSLDGPVYQVLSDYESSGLRSMSFLTHRSDPSLGKQYILLVLVQINTSSPGTNDLRVYELQ